MPRKLLCVLLTVSAVSEDCQSLLSIQSASNLTTKRTIQLFKDGLCYPVSEQGSTEIQDNHLDFSGWRGATLNEVKFEPIWYSITPGQPVAERCLIDDEVDKPNRIKFLCGRHGSEEVAHDFVSNFKNGSFLTSLCEVAGWTPLSCTNKYNFAIEGIMTFKFRSSEDFLVRKVRMRLAQWHWSHTGGLFHANVWSVLVMDECERKIVNIEGDLAELQCAESKLSIGPLPGHQHEFGVSPWPYD